MNAETLKSRAEKVERVFIDEYQWADNDDVATILAKYGRMAFLVSCGDYRFGSVYRDLSEILSKTFGFDAYVPDQDSLSRVPGPDSIDGAYINAVEDSKSLFNSIIVPLDDPRYELASQVQPVIKAAYDMINAIDTDMDIDKCHANLHAMVARYEANVRNKNAVYGAQLLSTYATVPIRA